MIKYALKCETEHEFEAWFANAAAFDTQSAASQLQCPVCGSAHVRKALMSPNISPSRQRERLVNSQGADIRQREALELLRKVKTFIEQNSEYVGPRFAEEALKIHYDEAESRSIYGDASEQDLNILRDEGVDFYTIPVLPEDKN